MKVRTQFNSHEFPKNHEINNSPTMTIPDQTMSMRELVQRYTRGLPLDQKTPVYVTDEENIDDLDMVDFKRLDLSERQEIREKYANELEEIQNRQKQQKPKKQPKNEPEQQPEPQA